MHPCGSDKLLLFFVIHCCCPLSVDVNDGSDDDIPSDDNSIMPESGKLDTSNRNSL